jgi:hypothetical protein
MVSGASMSMVKSTTKPPNYKVEVKVDYVDAPMKCCGLGTGQELTNSVELGKYRQNAWQPSYWYKETRLCEKEDIKTRLKKLREYADGNNRNCLMVTISSEQERNFKAKAAAEEEGFRCVHEFYNPNSGNQVYIMVQTMWASFDEYREAVGSDQDEDNPF